LIGQPFASRLVVYAINTVLKAFRIAVFECREVRELARTVCEVRVRVRMKRKD
jgi:hypothetical protein